MPKTTQVNLGFTRDTSALIENHKYFVLYHEWQIGELKIATAKWDGEKFKFTECSQFVHKRCEPTFEILGDRHYIKGFREADEEVFEVSDKQLEKKNFFELGSAHE